MVDWEKLFDGLFKAVAAHGIDPALVLGFLALIVAALLVSAMGLALWCVLAAIKRMAPPTPASSAPQVAEARYVVDILKTRKWQDMQGKDSDRLRQLEEHRDDRQGALLRPHQQDRRQGGEGLPVGRRSVRRHRR